MSRSGGGDNGGGGTPASAAAAGGSKSSGSTPYRTQSDTLKLQRLIEVLKERGSDLGNSLEATASDFLGDVKQRQQQQPQERAVPHYEDGEEASGSSYEEGDDEDKTEVFESDLEDDENARPPPKTPPPTPAVVIEAPKLPDPPRLPPPPVPTGSSPVLPRYNRRSASLSDMAASKGNNPDSPPASPSAIGPVVATIKKKVHFLMDESDSEEETSPRKGDVLSALVKKSTAVLKTLTMSLSDPQIIDESERQPISPQTPSSSTEIEEQIPKPSPPEEETLPLNQEEDGESSEYEEFTDASSDSEPNEAGENAPKAQPGMKFQFYCEKDPPDPEELKKLHKPKKPRQTLAYRWRKQKEKERKMKSSELGRT